MGTATLNKIVRGLDKLKVSIFQKAIRGVPLAILCYIFVYITINIIDTFTTMSLDMCIIVVCLKVIHLSKQRRLNPATTMRFVSSDTS